MRHFVSTFVVLAAMINATLAYGVTTQAKSIEHTSLAKVTTGAAQRAEVDVQIRRLHRMLVSNTQATESTFDRLQKLQQERQGKR